MASKLIQGILRAIEEKAGLAGKAVPRASTKGITLTHAPEHITSSAIIHNGQMYTGPNHFDMEIPGYNIDRDFKEENYGFTTNTGRFVSRAEAVAIARESGQVAKDAPLKSQVYENQLISEDIPGLTLNSNPVKGPVREYLSAAAIRQDGRIYTGEDHGQAGFDVPGYRDDGSIVEERPPEDYGFVTNTGRYVTRNEAVEIARKSGQLPDNSPIQEDFGLTAEDLAEQRARVIDEHIRKTMLGKK